MDEKTEIEFSSIYRRVGGYNFQIWDDGVVDLEIEGTLTLRVDELQELASIAKSFRDRRVTYKAKLAAQKESEDVREAEAD